jgi:peptidoglycan/LPS O-acetylase OafA/YrhL
VFTVRRPGSDEPHLQCPVPHLRGPAKRHLTKGPLVGREQKILTRKRRVATHVESGSPITRGHVFDPRNNALYAWRLTLATGVILMHSYLLTGHHLPVTDQVLRGGWVDGFFALSGFLITGSWLNNPKPRTYFAARALRILPGLWVCLIVTAFIIAPAAGTVKLSSQIGYILKNGTLLPLQQNIDGTPTASFHIWNGSLWTLLFEALCYTLVAGLGIVGLLNRWFMPVALAATITWAALLPPGLFSGT